MFLEIEADQLINLAQVTRIELVHHKKFARLYVAGTYIESELAYAYLNNRDNASFVMAPVKVYNSAGAQNG